MLLVAGSQHAPAFRPQSLVLRQGEGNGLPAVERSALAREVPKVALGLDAFEPPRGLVNARVELDEDVSFGPQLVFAPTGHTLRETRLERRRKNRQIAVRKVLRARA